MTKVKEKLIGAYEMAANVCISQNRNADVGQNFVKAAELAEEIFGMQDKRAIELRQKAEEIGKLYPRKDFDLQKDTTEPLPHSEIGVKITKESILATPYGTFNGTRMKLIAVDYNKGKTVKIFGMKKDGTFAKSLYLPYSMFQSYFNVEGKVITAQDIKNENVIEWYLSNYLNFQIG